MEVGKGREQKRKLVGVNLKSSPSLLPFYAPGVLPQGEGHNSATLGFLVRNNKKR